MGSIEKDYLNINRQLWNDKVAVHASSDFYDVSGFLKGATSLNEIETPLLGDISKKRVLHLQCHFGLDSLSMARMGADVTGVDLSDKAIDKARQLAEDTGIDAKFIQSDVYDLQEKHKEKYDLVFSSYGTIGWLPDLKKWAQVVNHFLKPGGRLLLVEFHPVVWMFDDEFKKVAYSYFNCEAIVETTEGTYADRESEISNQSVSWNHPLGDVISSLLGQDLQVTHFSEYDYSPYNCFMNTVEIAPSRFQIKGMEGKLPMVYALEILKRQ